MLSPEDRRLYSGCFAAPIDYVFDRAVGTTFSLDLESLLFAQFCLATSGAGEPEDALRDPVGLLEAIHRTADRVTVFCHAGETNAPEGAQLLYGLLEQSLIPARARGEGAIFHPKLWLLRFRERDTGEPLLRAVVLSRNLTTSRAWDSFVCLEGSPERRRAPESQQLADLVRALPGLSLQQLSEARRADLERLASEVERTVFDAPLPFEGTAHFLATGIGPERHFRPTETGERLLAISPFVSKSALIELRKLAPPETACAELIGRPEEMARCPAEVIAAWRAFCLDDAACSDGEAADDEALDRTADAAPQGLHAKALVVQSRRRTVWWLGSGNLTDPVRSGASVELMVRLEGKTSKVGIDAFLSAGFGKLLQEYRHGPPPDDPQEGNRAAVEKAKKALVAAQLRLACAGCDDDWELLLTGTASVPEGVSATCRPLTLPLSRAIALAPGAPEHRFSALTVEALTALIAFRLSAGSGEALYTADVTLKLPIAGLPPERDARISRSIIKDRVAFLNYLRCLLAGVGGTLLEKPPEGSKARCTGTGDDSANVFGSGLLEQLLRALHEEPERLRGIRSLLDRAESDASSPIPEDFRQIWKVIEPHLTALEAASATDATEGNPSR